MDYELKRNDTSLWRGTLTDVVIGQPSALVALGMLSQMYRPADRRLLRIHEALPTRVVLGYDYYQVLPREINDKLDVPCEKSGTYTLTHVFTCSEHDAPFSFLNFLCLVEACVANSPEIDFR